ncbi:ATP-dependent RNA helicase DeaD [Carboxydocella thermautotrophica]|nr:ATP-dependent RNA helicase DeaD [Carboxydocella thermautotrophica]
MSQEKYFFGNLQLSKNVYRAIKEMGFEEPSPIQTQAIPPLLANKDVIGQAQTGTGKTAAFGIPIVEKINPRYKGVQALVLTPTRELAIQVAEEISKIGKFKEVKTLPIYGGQPIERQIHALKKGVQIVIGTPGRILDHLNRKTLILNNVKMVVLDEADEMLDMGFIDDIQTIFEFLPETRQTLLFSATMPVPILSLAKKYLNEPEWITVSKDELTVPLIEQIYYEVRENERLAALCRILDASQITQAIIFCRTKKGVDDLVGSLQARGYAVDGLHGDLTQSQRDKVMNSFRLGKLEFLVATDVAARGIDVDNVSHVINYEVPQDPESYVHRIGRTGRAGRQGTAITLVVPREYKQLRLIEKLANTSIRKEKLPTLADIAERRKENVIARIEQIVSNLKLEDYYPIIEELTTRYELRDIAAALLFGWIEPAETVVNEIEDNDDDSLFQNTGAGPGMVRFFINVGKEDEITVKDLISFIVEEAGIEEKQIGNIRLLGRFSFVEIQQDIAEKVYYCLQKTYLRGRRINVEPARNRQK